VAEANNPHPLDVAREDLLYNESMISIGILVCQFRIVRVVGIPKTAIHNHRTEQIAQ